MNMIRIIAGSIIAFVVAYALVRIFTRYVLRTSSSKKWPAVLCGIGAMLLHLFLLPVSSNDDSATITPSDSSYVLMLTGKRLEAGGSLFSSIYPCLRRDTFRIRVPATKGIVNIKGQTGHSGALHVFGRIVFSQDSAVVELYYDNTVDRTTDLLDWNGRYSLLRPKK